MPVTLPLSQALTVYTGTTFLKEFRWLPDGTHPQDFTGWTGVMRIGAPGQTALVALSTLSGGVTLSSTGHIVLVMAPVLTSTLAEGVYQYQVDLTSPDGTVIRFLRGRCEVITDVSD